MRNSFRCDCFYCTGYTKEMLIELKEKIADREMNISLSEYEGRYSSEDWEENKYCTDYCCTTEMDFETYKSYLINK